MNRDLDEQALSIVLQLAELSPAECEALRRQLLSGDDQLRAAVDELLKAHDVADRNPLFHSLLMSVNAESCAASGSDSGGGRQDGRTQPPRLERFVPIDVLGLGGQGEVWLMLDPRIDRRVALKIVQPSQKGSKATLSSFRREAEISGKLEHPNIVPVYDVTSELTSSGAADPESPCFVMRLFGDPRLHVAIEAFHAGQRSEKDRELVDAIRAFERRQNSETRTTLEQQLQLFSFDLEQECDRTLQQAVESILRDDSDSGTLTKAITRFHASEWSEIGLRKLLGRFQRVCEGVAYAHSRGVIHRDLKPDNIMLGEYGETLVADWGMAKVVGRSESDSNQATEGTLEITSENSGSEKSRLGDLKGTPRYMSPEQALGRNDELTAATDIYSLGAILYRIVTGRNAIDAELHPDVLRQVRDGRFQPPRSVNRNVPAAMEAIILKAMSHRPEERYASALALSADIENWLNDEPVSAWHEPLIVRTRRWMRRHQTSVVASLATLTVAIISLGIVAVVVAGKNKELDQQKTVVDQQNAELSKKNNELEIARDDADQQRSKAESNAIEAENNARTARENELKAVESEREIGELLVNSTLSRGEEAASEYDYSLARQAFAEALLIAETRTKATPEDLAIHRTRLGVLENLAPRLRLNVFGTAPLLDATFSPAGDVIALLQTQKGTIRLVDVATGSPRIDGFKNKGAVRAMAFSPDGTRLISWAMSFDHTALISLWNAETGELIHEASAAGPVSRLSYSPDGTMIGLGCAVGGLFGESGQIELRSANDLALIGTAIATTHPVTSIAFSSDSKLLAATVPGSKSPVAVYKTSDRTLASESGELPPQEFCDVVFSPDGTRICVASNSGSAVLLDGLTGKSIANLVHREAMPESAVDSYKRKLGIARFSPDGQFLLTACGDKTVRLWKAESGQPVGQTMAHQDHVTDCGFSPDGNLIGTCSIDGTARLWSPRAGNTVISILRHTAPIHAIQIQSAQSILTAGEDKLARLWSVQSPTPLAPAGGTAPSQSLVSKDGRFMAGQVTDKTIQVWNSSDMSPSGPAVVVKHPVHRLAIADDGAVLAAAGFDDDSVGRLSVVNFATGQFVEEAVEVSGLPLSVLFSPDSRWCAVQTSSAGVGKKLTVHGLQEHTSIAVDLPEPDELIWNPANPAELLVGCRDGRVRRVRFPEGTSVETSVDTESSVIRHLAISPDGKLLAVTTGNSVVVWSTDNWQPASQPLTHDAEPNGAAFSSDSTDLITWGRDGVVRFWSRQENQLDWRPTGQVTHQASVNYAVFNKDGRRIATASDDRTAMVWDRVSQRAVSPPLMHQSPDLGELEVQEVIFSADGESLFTSSQNSVAFLQSLPLATISANLRMDPRAMESTLTPLLMRSMMQTWRWNIKTVTDDTNVLVRRLEFETGLRLDRSEGWRRLTSDEQYQVIDEIAEHLPNGWAVRQLLAQQAKASGELADAENQYVKALQAKQDDGLLWHEYGSVLYDQDKFQPAVDAENKASALGYSDSRVHLVRGRALLYLDRFEEALADLTIATQRSLVPQYARLDLANSQAMLGRFDEAAASFDQSFTEHRKFGDKVEPGDQYRRMILDLARNQPDEYRKRLRQFLKANQRTEDPSTAYYVILAAILRPDSVDDWTQVNQLSEQAAKTDPNSATFQALPGYAKFRAGQFVESEAILRAAIALQPPVGPATETPSPLPHYFLAMCLQAQSKSAAARESLKTANELLERSKAGPDFIALYVRLPWNRRTMFELIKAEAEAHIPAEKP